MSTPEGIYLAVEGIDIYTTSTLTSPRGNAVADFDPWIPRLTVDATPLSLHPQLHSREATKAHSLGREPKDCVYHEAS